MFRDSWPAISFVVLGIYGFGWYMVGHLLAARICFLVANAILLWALCTHPDIHGPRLTRKEPGYRKAAALIITIVIIALSNGLSLFCGRRVFDV
jgi:hypothetical protein